MYFKYLMNVSKFLFSNILIGSDYLENMYCASSRGGKRQTAYPFVESLDRFLAKKP